MSEINQAERWREMLVPDREKWLENAGLSHDDAVFYSVFGWHAFSGELKKKLINTAGRDTP